MNYRMILKMLCSVLRIVAIFMVPAAVISICYHEMPTFWGFVITMALMLLMSLSTFVFRFHGKAAGLIDFDCVSDTGQSRGESR